MKDLLVFCTECRRKLILYVMFITLCGCSDSQDNCTHLPLVESFRVKVNNEYINGTIDETTNRIILEGVQEGSLIVEVDYGMAENATIYPKPETRVNDWQPEERFVIVCNGKQRLYTVILADYEDPVPEENLGDAVISPEKYYGRQIKDFFYDLKLNASAINTAAKANEFFVEDGMNGVRVSIYGDATRPAHPEPGKIDESYYTKMIASINRAKTARGDKGLIIGASKKLDGKNSFPDWVKDKNGVAQEYKSDAETRLNVPMAVLINGNSASASEIFAGAVQDYGVGTLVGTTTFGKGIVQTIFSLNDGTGLKLTIEDYYLPSGKSIHQVGVSPDVEIDLPDELKVYVTIPEDQDTQLQKAIEILKEQK